MASTVWERISTAAGREFSDVADVEQLTQLLLRMGLAALLGGVLGYEREAKGKFAGIRTHMLVCMGAALFVFLPQQSGMQADAISRVVQGVIAGIGFLGAGTILKAESEERIKGLTTAAGIWLTAAVGVAAGMGREVTAVLCTVLALGILVAVPLEARIAGRSSE